MFRYYANWIHSMIPVDWLNVRVVHPQWQCYHALPCHTIFTSRVCHVNAGPIETAGKRRNGRPPQFWCGLHAPCLSFFLLYPLRADGTRCSACSAHALHLLLAMQNITQISMFLCKTRHRRQPTPTRFLFALFGYGFTFTVRFRCKFIRQNEAFWLDSHLVVACLCFGLLLCLSWFQDYFTLIYCFSRLRNEHFGEKVRAVWAAFFTDISGPFFCARASICLFFFLNWWKTVIGNRYGVLKKLRVEAEDAKKEE